jgi:hypothetical protein
VESESWISERTTCLSRPRVAWPTSMLMDRPKTRLKEHLRKSILRDPAAADGC